MSNFKGNYLRVLTPVTSNGVIPIMDENGQAQYKESHLPLTARKFLEKKNKKLAKHLQHRIEEVGDGTTQETKGRTKTRKNG